MYTVKNLTHHTILADKCEIADNFWLRFKGLMGRSYLPQDSGLIITPCNSIHMFFMKIPLDIVFITNKNTVIHTIENIRPWKFSKIITSAYSVIELPIGTIKNCNIQVGDLLSIEKHV